LWDSADIERSLDFRTIQVCSKDRAIPSMVG
jgi:hypothetical protein